MIARVRVAACLLTALGFAPAAAWSQTDAAAARPHVPSAEVGTCIVAPVQVVEETGREGATPMRVEAGPLSFSVTWDPSVPLAWRTVIQQAMNEWSGLLSDQCITTPLPLFFRVKELGGSTLGLTQPFSNGSGCIVRDTIDFDVTTNWFIDPSPADDSEFTDPIVPPPGGYDLLSVARHEVGHAVGWTVTSRNTGMFSGDIFAPVRLNAWTTQTGGFHVNASWLPSDLMVPSIGLSTRRAINRYPDAAVPARGLDGSVSQMSFVDPTYGGVQTGSPWQPYSTIPNADAFAPAPNRIMLANTTHHTPVNTVMSSVRVWDSVRDGATIVAP